MNRIVALAALLVLMLAACSPGGQTAKKFGEDELKKPLLDWKQDPDLATILKQFPEIEGYERDLQADKTRDDSAAFAKALELAKLLTESKIDEGVIARAASNSWQLEFTPEQAARILELTVEFAKSADDIAARVAMAGAPLRQRMDAGVEVIPLTQWTGIAELCMACHAAKGDIKTVVKEGRQAVAILNALQYGGPMANLLAVKVALQFVLRCIGTLAVHAPAADAAALAGIVKDADGSINFREANLRTMVSLVCDARMNMRKVLPLPSEADFKKWLNERDEFVVVMLRRAELAAKLPAEKLSAAASGKLLALVEGISAKGDPFEAALAEAVGVLVKTTIELKAHREMALFLVASRTASRDAALKDLQAALKECGLKATDEAGIVRIDIAPESPLAKIDRLKSADPIAESKYYTEKRAPLSK
ncbi:MAG: hypothetical protein IT462_03025 [Planctomycetes bacterium]|nr:hypothetical protein [Planctomycetota bacterium]